MLPPDPPLTQFSNREGGHTHAQHHLFHPHLQPQGLCDFPSEVHEHIDLGQAWEFFRGYATHDSADLYSRIELVERDWEDLSERVLARLELAERF